MKRTSIPTIVTVIAISLSGALLAKGGKGKGNGKGAKGGPDAAAIFNAIDANDDGVITPRELGDSKRFKDASRKEVGEAFQEKDLNGDGEISRPEFLRTFGPKGKGGKGGRKGDKGKGGPGKGGDNGPGKEKRDN